MRSAPTRRAPVLLEEMRTLCEGGSLSAAARLFDAAPPANITPEATILRGRIYIKADDAPAAIRLVEKLRAGDDRVLAQRDLVLASAHAWVGSYSVADTLFSRVAKRAQRLGDVDLISDGAYYQAQRYLFERRTKAARALLTQAQTSFSESSQLRAFHLQSFILNYEGHHREQARTLLELLRRIDPYKSTHMEIRAWATQALAALGRELYLPEAAPEVERQLGGTPWPSDFYNQRFQAFRSVAWTCALRGDTFNAFRYLRVASQTATNDAWRMIAAAERAELARCSGEQLWSRDELALAEEYASRVDWGSVRDESLMGLLLLAELLATIDLSKAAYYQARFNENKDVKAPNLFLHHDARLIATAQYSAGMIELASGRRKAGRDLLKRALSTFGQHEYGWRAGRAALALYEELGAKTYAAQAAEHLQHYMNSWLGDKLRGVSSPSSRLTPTQKRVYEMLQEGRSTGEIVRELGRSVFTVRNHVKAILKTMGARSRLELLAKVALQDSGRRHIFTGSRPASVAHESERHRRKRSKK